MQVDIFMLSDAILSVVMVWPSQQYQRYWAIFKESKVGLKLQVSVVLQHLS